MNIKETKKNIIQAGNKAVEELIKVAKEAIVDSDLFVIDNGAGGTNRKTTASRLKTYIGDSITFDHSG